MAPIQSDDLNHFDFTQSVVGEPMIQLLRREANYRVPALRQFGTGRDRLLLAGECPCRGSREHHVRNGRHATQTRH